MAGSLAKRSRHIALAENDDVGAGIVRGIDPPQLRRNTQHRQIVGGCGFTHQPRGQLANC